MTHLDTTFVVDLIREKARKQRGPATQKLDELAEEQIAVCVHVTCELQAGAELSRDPARERERIAALLKPLATTYPDERFPARYGALLAELQRRGEAISTMDLLIATAALVDEASLVSRNAREFERVPGLRVISY